MSIPPPFRSFGRPGLPDFGPTPSARPSPGSCPIRQFCVVLHRTAGQDLLFVVRAVMDVTHFGDAEAECRMWKAHHSGKALVLVTHLERAELYAEQFADRGLRVSLEPA